MKKMEKDKGMEEQLHLEQTKERFRQEKSHVIQQEVVNVYRYRYNSSDFDNPCRVDKYIIANRHRQFLIEFLQENEVVKETIQEFQSGPGFSGETDGFGYSRSVMNITLYGLPKPVQGHLILPGIAIGNPEVATTLVEEVVPVDDLGNPDDDELPEFFQALASKQIYEARKTHYSVKRERS